MRKPGRITSKLLVEQKYCGSEITLFKRTFPRGCRVTRATVLKALRAGLNVFFFAEDYLWACHFVPKRDWDRYYDAIMRSDDRKQHAWDRKFRSLRNPKTGNIDDGQKLYEFEQYEEKIRSEAWGREADLFMRLWRAARRVARPW